MLSAGVGRLLAAFAPDRLIPKAGCSVDWSARAKLASVAMDEVDMLRAGLAGRGGGMPLVMPALLVRWP